MEPIVKEIEEIKQVINYILEEYNHSNKMRIDCTKAILDCWELVEYKESKQPRRHNSGYEDPTLVDDQADIIKKIRDTLDPIVKKIYQEGN